MALTDLTGTKWEFESTLSDNISLDVSINYTSNETSFDRLAIVFIASISYAQITYVSGQTQTSAYNKGWLNEAFKTIEITGGTDATNASLIAFLEAHATQVVEPTDVMISYGGSYIATMSDSGTEVLETAGKYLTDDITIDYTKSGGGGGATHVSGTVLFGSKCYYTTPSGTITTVEPDPMTSRIDIDVLAGSMLVIFNAAGTEDTLSNATYSSTLSLGSRASYKYAVFYQVS